MLSWFRRNVSDFLKEIRRYIPVYSRKDYLDTRVDIILLPTFNSVLRRNNTHIFFRIRYQIPIRRRDKKKKSSLIGIVYK